MTFTQRDAPGANTEREQASGGELRAEWPTGQQPAPAGGGATGAGGARGRQSTADTATGLRAGAVADPAAEAGPAPRRGARMHGATPSKDCEAEPAGQEHRRQRRREPAQRDHVGTT